MKKKEKQNKNKTENTCERTKAQHNQQWMDVYKLCDFSLWLWFANKWSKTDEDESQNKVGE